MKGTNDRKSESEYHLSYLHGLTSMKGYVICVRALYSVTVHVNLAWSPVKSIKQQQTRIKYHLLNFFVAHLFQNITLNQRTKGWLVRVTQGIKPNITWLVARNWAFV